MMRCMRLVFPGGQVLRLICVLLLVGLVLALPRSSYAQTPLDLLWQQVAAQPEDFAVACMPLDRPGQTVFYNAGTRMPLASVSKLLIFIEYARRVDVGQIALDEAVSVNALEQYNLPRTDRGAHDRFLENYPADILTLPLWDVAVEGMMQYSSNAASDYLLDRLSPVDWTGLYQTLFVLDTDAPHSLTMIPLLMNNHITRMAGLDDLSGLSVELGESYLDAYVTDSTWRTAEINYRSGGGRRFPAWEVQAAVLRDYTALGNVNDFLNVLQSVYGESQALSENVKYMVRTALRWEGNDYIAENYVEYGSKLGFYSGGVLTLVAYGQPFNGERVISATFFQNIPRDHYNQMLREDSIGDFAHWMNFNGCAGLREQIERMISG